MQTSILRKLRLYMLGFGVLMGFIFPLYSGFFVEWKEGMLVYFVMGCIAAGIIVGVVSYVFVKVILLRPLLKVSNVANMLKEKNINGRIELSSNDSVGDIVNGINASCDHISSFLLEIETTTRLNHQLLEQVKVVGGDKENSIATCDESIKTVTSSAESISDHSSQICKTLANSQDAVTEWMSRIEGMKERIEVLKTRFNLLISNSEKITGILSTIEDIARQTNLVSTNATIEAATAGSYGRGFAVVANEIKNLSESVSNSAKDILKYTRLINEAITESNEAVVSITENIADNIVSSKGVKANLDRIEDISKSNYKADKQLIQSVKNLNSSFQSIEKVLSELADNAGNLQNILSSFDY